MSLPTIICTSLRDANRIRDKEWGEGRLSPSFFGYELGGEVGKALDEAMQLIALAAATGKAQNHIKKLEREALGLKGSRTTTAALAEELADIIIYVDLVAMQYSIPLAEAIAAKFNATSKKLNLTTRLDLKGEL